MTDRFESACEYANNVRGFSRWQARDSLIQYYPLCKLCFPDNQVPEKITHVIRCTSHGSSSNRQLHVAKQDKPDDWEIAKRGNANPDSGGPILANKLADPNVTELDQLSDVVSDD